MKGKLSYPLFKTIKRLLKNVSVQNKKIYLYFLIYTITATIYPFFSVVLPKLLIRELSLGSRAAIENIITIILGYLLLTAIFGFIRTYIKEFANPQITRLRIDYIRDMFDKIVSVDYKYMEDATFFEVNGKAMEATSGSGNGVEGMYDKLFVTPSMVLTTLAFVVFIGMLNIFILLGLFLNILVSMWISRKVHNYRYNKRQDLTHAERRKYYYYTTTHDFSYGKDIRIYSFKDRILHNYSKEI